MEFSFILASQSPRRKLLLERLGYNFSVQASNFDERSVSEALAPREYVVAVATGKLESVAQKSETGQIILASDLTVWNEKKLVHKPKDLDEARLTLPKLMDTWHTEWSAIVVRTPNGEVTHRVSKSRVWLPPLRPHQLDEYLKIADPTDKAGGVDVACFEEVAGQGAVRIEGSVSNVIGLDVVIAAHLLKDAGLPPRQSPSQVEHEVRLETLGNV